MEVARLMIEHLREGMTAANCQAIPAALQGDVGVCARADWLRGQRALVSTTAARRWGRVPSAPDRINVVEGNDHAPDRYCFGIVGLDADARWLAIPGPFGDDGRDVGHSGR
jgi:hypothetical protein